MNKPPERIYLQIYDEDGDLRDPISDDVTWCADRINENDVAYVLEEPDKDPPKAILCFEGEEIEFR